MKNQVPKQDLSKPEKSIQIMQQRHIAGQRKPQPAIKNTQGAIKKSSNKSAAAGSAAAANQNFNAFPG